MWNWHAQRFSSIIQDIHYYLVNNHSRMSSLLHSFPWCCVFVPLSFLDEHQHYHVYTLVARNLAVSTISWFVHSCISKITVVTIRLGPLPQKLFYSVKYSISFMKASVSILQPWKIKLDTVSTYINYISF